MIEPLTALSLATKAGAVDSTKVPASIPAREADAQSLGSFADTLSNLGNSTVESLNKAESISIEALRGNAGTREVADAVMSAEQSLQVAIAIRDKVVTAYLEISRMAI